MISVIPSLFKNTLPMADLVIPDPRQYVRMPKDFPLRVLTTLY